MRALAALGPLSERRAGVFAATDTGALLGEKHPDSVAVLVRMSGDPTMLRAWDHLGGSVRTAGFAPPAYAELPPPLMFPTIEAAPG
ncbi:hypothetical protein GCM10009801_01000 [Streptomyces albiaxialis]|uniref:Uncharacterized protein n=1 Tax=Streptomyces albiaxialis TaxID=329523 RepID=A0ABN2VDI9_9ACTN